MKKFLALTGLIVACSLPFAAQSLECSVKPKVISIEAPHSYMFVGNSYTYYSSGLAGVLTVWQKLPESKSDATVW